MSTALLLHRLRLRRATPASAFRIDVCPPNVCPARDSLWVSMLRWLVGPEAAPPLEAIARKATAVDPAARYPDVATLSADVARFLDGAAVSAYSESLYRRALRIARRHRIALGIVVAYLAGRTAIWIATGR